MTLTTPKTFTAMWKQRAHLVFPAKRLDNLDSALKNEYNGDKTISKVQSILKHRLFKILKKRAIKSEPPKKRLTIYVALTAEASVPKTSDISPI
jgi:hypothetical protein